MAGAAASADDRGQKLAAAKKVETKTGGGLDPAALAAMEKVYTENGGDLGKISAKLGGVKFKAGTTVKDAKDFATRMLLGTIVDE